MAFQRRCMRVMITEVRITCGFLKRRPLGGVVQPGPDEPARSLSSSAVTRELASHAEAGEERSA